MKKFIMYFFALSSALMLTSCVGDLLKPREKDPTRFYVLHSLNEVQKISGMSDKSINMMPVKLPEYFLRSQIVTQVASSVKVDVSDFDRWLEMPDDSFSRVISVNVSRIMESENVYLTPFVSPEQNAPTLRIVIMDCIGELGGEMSFKARWEIVGGDERNPVKVNKLFVKKYKCGDSYESYVKAIETALYELSVDIVKGFSTFGK